MGVFIKFGEIDGDATLGAHGGFIAADHFSWGGARTVGGQQQRGGRVHYEKCVFQKRVDIASVSLLRDFSQTRVAASVEVKMTNSDNHESGNEDYSIVFKQCIIFEFRYVFSDALLFEEITFGFEEYDATFSDESPGGGTDATTDTLV